MLICLRNGMIEIVLSQNSSIFGFLEELRDRVLDHHEHNIVWWRDDLLTLDISLNTEV